MQEYLMQLLSCLFFNSEDVNSKDFYTETFSGNDVPLGKCCGHKEIGVVGCGYPSLPGLVSLQLLERVEDGREVALLW